MNNNEENRVNMKTRNTRKLQKSKWFRDLGLIFDIQMRDNREPQKHDELLFFTHTSLLSWIELQNKLKTEGSTLYNYTKLWRGFRRYENGYDDNNHGVKEEEDYILQSGLSTKELIFLSSPQHPNPTLLSNMEVIHRLKRGFWLVVFLGGKRSLYCKLKRKYTKKRSIDSLFKILTG